MDMRRLNGSDQLLFLLGLRRLLLGKGALWCRAVWCRAIWDRVI
jgi:hypothetical protein